MSGLDRIVEEIRRQADTEAEEILKKADEYCDSYMEDVKKNVQKEIEDYNKKALAERVLYEEKTQSGGEFKERNAMLKAKQQCIGKVIEAAENKIINFSAEEYFELLEKILEANVAPGDGIIKMNKKDLERMTPQFENKIKEIAEKYNGTLTISNKPCDMKGGFILVYGDIEENCTLDAMFAVKAEQLKDIANKELFC